MGPWLVLLSFGVYHGLNPGMGWLFALSLGLQQKSGRAIWVALFPIAAGHAVSVAVVAGMVWAGMRLVSPWTVQVLIALVLFGFGIYKMGTYYRHPRWVGMKVGLRDLFVWSFLMATAHGAGLMVGPALVGVARLCGSPDTQLRVGTGLLLAVGLHTSAMLVVMGGVAWGVYKKFGLAVLRQQWINFDLIWAVALLIVGGMALVLAL
ncbi:MAG: hypothetical protein D6736_09695 [Nitrospinota bacterium]|nr:MAG: hypothetical protein D6736_09695 [Nitrospinota bacterium]